jgi:hypothetical protein
MARIRIGKHISHAPRRRAELELGVLSRSYSRSSVPPYLASSAAPAPPGLANNVGRPCAKRGIQPLAIVDLRLTERGSRFKRSRVLAYESLQLNRRDVTPSLRNVARHSPKATTANDFGSNQWANARGTGCAATGSGYAYDPRGYPTVNGAGTWLRRSLCDACGRSTSKQ